MTDEERHAHRGGDRYLRRILLYELIDGGRHDVVAVRQTEHERSRERAQHLREHEDRGAENARQNQRQGHAQHRSQAARAHHLRRFFQRRVHRLHHGADHHKGDRAFEQRHDPGDAIGRVDVDEVFRAAKRAPRLIDEAAFRRSEQAPGQRAEKWRQIVRDHHQLLEQPAPGHVGAGEHPGHQEAEHQRHHGGGQRDRQRVEDDLRVLEEAAEIIEPVGCRRSRFRIADVQRGLKEEENRIKDEDRRRCCDQQADDLLRREARPPRLHNLHCAAALEAEHRVPFLGEGFALGAVFLPVLRE